MTPKHSPHQTREIVYIGTDKDAAHLFYLYRLQYDRPRDPRVDKRVIRLENEQYAVYVVTLRKLWNELDPR